MLKPCLKKTMNKHKTMTFDNLDQFLNLPHKPVILLDGNDPDSLLFAKKQLTRKVVFTDGFIKKP